MALTILDGSNPTLDASQLSYEFEKARIKGVEGTKNLGNYIPVYTTNNILYL